jgi:hypothetical protein
LIISLMSAPTRLAAGGGAAPKGGRCLKGLSIAMLVPPCKESIQTEDHSISTNHSTKLGYIFKLTIILFQL